MYRRKSVGLKTGPLRNSSMNWIFLWRLPIQNHQKPPITEKRRNKAKFLTWNSTRPKLVKRTSLPNSVERLGCINCINTPDLLLLQSGPDAFDEQRFVKTFLTISWVIKILCRFRLLIEEKTGKEIPKSSRFEFLEKFLANSFALSDAEDNTSGSLNRGGIYSRFTIVENTISNLPKVPRTKFLRSDGCFCFSSICKFGSFKNPFVTITSLPEL